MSFPPLLYFKLMLILTLSHVKPYELSDTFNISGFPSTLELENCPPFISIEHGKSVLKILPNGTLGAIVTCHENYTLIGPKIVQCIDGDWKFGPDEIFPRCGLRCSPPPYLEHGTLSLQKRIDDVYLPSGSYSEGTIVSYNCDVGFALEPEASSIRVCDKGVWTGVDAYCRELREMSCPRPLRIKNGYTDFLYNEPARVGFKISYECNAGYRLVGSETVICNGEGIWVPEAPSCISQDESGGNPFADFSAAPAPAVANGAPDFFSQTASHSTNTNQNLWNTGNAFQAPVQQLPQQPFGDLTGVFNTNNSSVFDLASADSKQIPVVPAQPNMPPPRPAQPSKILTGDLESSLNSLVENLTMDSGSGKWSSPKNQPKTAVGWQPQMTAGGTYRPMMGVQPQMMPQQPFMAGGVLYNPGYQQSQVGGNANVAPAGTEVSQQPPQQPAFDPFGAL